MGDSLPRYVESRVHEWVDDPRVRRVRVVGVHDRVIATPSSKEKRDKSENWQRPTAVRFGPDLEIRCFPGRAYVFHCASLIATRFLLTGRDPARVEMELPGSKAARTQLQLGGLLRAPKRRVALVASGSRWVVPCAPSDWVDHGDVVSSTASQLGDDVTCIAVKHSFWGDISYHVGRLLAEMGFSLVVFVGKLGSLRIDDVPNRSIVTGCTSWIGGGRLAWDRAVHWPASVGEGSHVTLPSVLQETTRWYETQRDRFDFVDPEIGHFASGVTDGGGAFSFLHIVSDNLNGDHCANLSNERESAVRQERISAFGEIRELLRDHLVE